MVPPPWRGPGRFFSWLNTFVSSLVIWCLTLILVLQPELSEQYMVQIHGTNFTPPSKCWGSQQCPPPARTTLVGGPQSTPPSWDRIRIWQIEAVVVPVHISMVVGFYPSIFCPSTQTSLHNATYVFSRNVLCPLMVSALWPWLQARG